MNLQALGLVIAAAGGTLLWSAWALVICGAILVLLPELRDAVRR